MGGRMGGHRGETGERVGLWLVGRAGVQADRLSNGRTEGGRANWRVLNGGRSQG